MNRTLNVLTCLAIVCMVLVTSVPASAQDPDRTEAMQLSGHIVKLQYEIRPAGPPLIEMVSDNRVVFSIQTSGAISGDLQGTLTTRITEVHPEQPPAHQWITSVFVIETEAGRIEGFYTGTIHRPEGADSAELHARGQVLSVSGAFADLFRAEVYVQATVPFENGVGVGEIGGMVIAPE